MIKDITAIVIFCIFFGLSTHLRITEGSAPAPFVIGMLLSLPFVIFAIEDAYKAIHAKIYPKKFK